MSFSLSAIRNKGHPLLKICHKKKSNKNFTAVTWFLYASLEVHLTNLLDEVDKSKITTIKLFLLIVVGTLASANEWAAFV